MLLKNNNNNENSLAELTGDFFPFSSRQCNCVRTAMASGCSVQMNRQTRTVTIESGDKEEKPTYNDYVDVLQFCRTRGDRGTFNQVARGHRNA